MSEFDEWYKKETKSCFDKKFFQEPTIKYAFEAGQQSQQAKIELLEKELTETQAFLNNQNHIKQAKIDELQARVDELQAHSLMLREAANS